MVANINASTIINQFDLDLPRNEYRFGLPEAANRWITNTLFRRNGKKNLPILYVMLNVLLTAVPSAIALYCLEGNIPNLSLIPLGGAYVYFLLTIYARSFILGLHYSTHVPMFNKQWKGLKHIGSNLLCMFFGIPPLMYYAHHIAMHHSENNISPYDLSSTMPYQRDSKWEHFKYMLRFVVAIWVELPYVLIQKNRYKVALNCILGELFFFISIIYLFTISPIATTFVFILPTIVVSFALMQGNWKQHIFVDPDDPMNNYKSTFTCINTLSNSLNFNDGYHIEHHENPAMPWYRLPEYFQNQMINYAKHDAFIFTGIGSTQVGRMVLNGQLDELADHYVNVGQKSRTRAELIAEFERRLQKM